MDAGRRGPVRAAVPLLSVAVLLTGCGAIGDAMPGPDRSDYAQVIQAQERDLRDVTVTRVADARGTWKRVEGTAVLAVDLFREVSGRSGEFCPGVPAAAVDAALETLSPGVRGPWILTTRAGTRVDLAIEVVLKKAEDPSSERDFVSSGGWTWAAIDGGYEVPDTDRSSRGQPARKLVGFDPARVVSAHELASACERARGR